MQRSEPTLDSMIKHLRVKARTIDFKQRFASFCHSTPSYVFLLSFSNFFIPFLFSWTLVFHFWYHSSLSPVQSNKELHANIIVKATFGPQYKTGLYKYTERHIRMSVQTIKNTFVLGMSISSEFIYFHSFTGKVRTHQLTHLKRFSILRTRTFR